ncbi:hypothetical protein Rhopal_000741-T1 [Rhodotorula paludigena]|uniref:Bestrophin, RFP-TM, chloride channel-domain-containing protein n=1 Tax=Rhodotorula paludigena TaxID=86838 RepID=A0AAV5G5H7_9BASI|nr:hypothetical protein Rhopal_000741-T1 [Rhodotorula paludigena]
MATLFRRIGQTVFPEILPLTVWFTLSATAVTVGCKVSGYAMEVNTIMLSILTTMLSFVISLRTSSALERWTAGRTAWSTVSVASRNLASLIWLHTGQTTLTAAQQADVVPGSDEDEIEKLKSLIEKRSILNLIQAFSSATKHYVRGESGVYWDDLYHLVKALPKYAFPSGLEDTSGIKRDVVTGLWRSPLPDGTYAIPTSSRAGATTPQFGTASFSSHLEADLEKGVTGSTDEVGRLPSDGRVRTIRLAPGFSPPKRTIYDYAPVFLLFRPLLEVFKPRAPSHKADVNTNTPLEIHMYISGYLAELMARGTIAPTLVGVYCTAMNQLADALGVMERVLSTPLPFSYIVHLRAAAYIYLVLLPFQIYDALGWLTIPAVFIASCVFLGFLELGQQLEMPFGYDDSDLDLDRYCALIAAEIQEIAAHSPPTVSSFTFSPLNTPFPLDRRSAPEILASFSQSHGGTDQDAVRGVPGMRRFLAKHFHDLEDRSRKEREWRKKHGHHKHASTPNTMDGDDDGRTVVVCTL